MIDTHCHLYLDEFSHDYMEVIRKAGEAGVSRFYMPAIDSSTMASMLKLERTSGGICCAMIGLHPCSVKDNYLDELALVQDWLSKRKFAAIGETGIDLYWDKTFEKQQFHALEIQIELALKYDMPIVLHTRNAIRETIDFVLKHSAKGLKGIFHCFGGSLQEAREIVAAGFYLGIGGVVTYKNSGLDKVLKEIDLEHLVLETDAPYLAPVPFRGKRNESSYLKIIAEKVAEIKEVSFEEVDNITTKNAQSLFAV
jgi:TatD DNase family protein